MSMHHAYRRITRSTLRRPVRCLNRSSFRGRRRGPDDLSQALTAFGRAIRAYRRLARLAPHFFDTALRDREALNRAEQRRWMALWEPALARVYGTEPKLPDPEDALPPLPSAKIQRKVDLKLAEREMCMIAGHAAMERYRQRRPHEVMSLSRMARLLSLAFDYKRLACGLETINPPPDLITYDYELTDLKRAYGQPDVPTPPPAAVRMEQDSAGSSSPGAAQTRPAFRG